MVFFTCNACGESLKKNQVEKHWRQRCRGCTVLTCVDCHRDFPGDEYAGHTKCITEAEKYSAKGWQPKSSANKVGSLRKVRHFSYGAFNSKAFLS